MGRIRKITGVFAAILIATALNIPVFAGEPVTAHIPVSCTAEGIDGKFTYVLHSDGEADPIKTLALGNGENGMFDLEFDQPGDYAYTANQVSGTDTDVTYDKSNYDVRVYVTEDDTGTMACEVVAYKTGFDEKVDAIRFVNSRKTVPTESDEIPSSSDSGRAAATIKPTISPRPGISRFNQISGDNGKTNPASVTSKQSRVKTGDYSRPVFFAGLFLIAALTLIKLLKRQGGREL